MATTEVSYDGKLIQPAPFISIVKNFIRSQNGEIIGSTFTLTITGKLFAYKGSPTSTKTWNTTGGYLQDETISSDARLGAILRKQEALRELFSIDGKQFVIQSADGSQPVKCSPRVIGPIEFPQGLWYEYVDYTINLETDRLYPEQEDTFLYLITDGSETWEVSTDDGTPEGIGLPRTYRLSHSVSAIGKRSFDDVGNLIQEPWENAREFVVPKLGFDSQFINSSGVRDLPSNYVGYNHVRTENIDRQGGGYAVSETWILASGTALEDFTVEQSQSMEDGLINIGINGSVVGLEQRDSSQQLLVTKYENANTKFSQVSGLALGRAQNYTGITLNIAPVSTTVGRNPVTGNITYAFAYNNRPSNLISGSRSESISINDNFHNNIIAEIPVLGRLKGPVLQDFSATQPLTRDISIEIVMPRPTFGSGSLSDLQSAFFGQRPSSAVSGIINACDPRNAGFSQVYIGTNSEGWEPMQGRYHRNISWTFEL